MGQVGAGWGRVAGTPLQCRCCDIWKCRTAVGAHAERQWLYRRCVDCVEKRRCRQCGEEHPRNMFSSEQWRQAWFANSRQGRCDNFVERSANGHWKCSGCKRGLARDTHFTHDLRDRTDPTKNNGTAKFDSCWMKDEKRRAGSWRCAGCGETLSAKSEYSKWLCKRTSKKQDGAQKWNACYVENEEVTPKVPRGSWPCKRSGKVLERREFSAWLGRRKCQTKKMEHEDVMIA